MNTTVQEACEGQDEDIEARVRSLTSTATPQLAEQ
jgi:hypothetical protein